MNACLDDLALLDIAEGRAPLEGDVEVHLARCSDCRRLFAAVARGGGSTVRDARPDEAEEPAWDELGAGVVVDGRYELEHFLGAGGMGVVWSARRLDDGATFALKIARSTDPELSRRFDREMRVLASLRHPSIVRVHELLPATTGRGPAIVQELLQGESLERLLVRVPRMTVFDAARVVLPIASALATAHRGGIVHRDLKPSNVYLTHDGRVVVVDFGIAKLLPEWGARTKLTRTGAVVGSPRFMAPEQLFGEEADRRADVWALGALLFQLLSGQSVFDSDRVGDVMKAVQAGAVPDLARAVPALPPDVLTLVRSALVVDRARRLQEVDAFATVLARYEVPRTFVPA